jgi:site-specific DNA recombinase
MLASVIAGLAEGELEAIRERGRSSRSKLRQLARWPGCKPPYGYTAVERGDGKGKTLEIDPLAKTVVRRIVDDLIDGKPLTRMRPSFGRL